MEVLVAAAVASGGVDRRGRAEEIGGPAGAPLLRREVLAARVVMAKMEVVSDPEMVGRCRKWCCGLGANFDGGARFSKSLERAGRLSSCIRGPCWRKSEKSEAVNGSPPKVLVLSGGMSPPKPTPAGVGPEGTLAEARIV